LVKEHFGRNHLGRDSGMLGVPHLNRRKVSGIYCPNLATHPQASYKVKYFFEVGEGIEVAFYG
jgi:hypothetical protein